MADNIIGDSTAGTPAGTPVTPVPGSTTPTTTTPTNNTVLNTVNNPDLTVGLDVGTLTGKESSLSNWAGPYVTEMLGKGWAAAELPYEAYTGPLTAGASDLQNQAFQGLANLTVPENMGAFTPQSWAEVDQSTYLNPYTQSVVQQQIDEANRQAQIQRMNDAARLTKAGAFGGSRQAIMESEGNRNLLNNIANITNTGYSQAYDRALAQFNTEEAARRAAQEQANAYGMGIIGAQQAGGAEQRGITAEGIAADKAQFEEERDYPYKIAQYMQSLLQDLPLATQSYSYTQPTGVASTAAAAGQGLSVLSGLPNIVDTIKGIPDAYNQLKDVFS